MKKVLWSLLFLVGLVVIECSLVGYIGIWREAFWQAVENKQLSIFIHKIIQFAIVALSACLVSGYSTYLSGKISLKLREQLTFKAMISPEIFDAVKNIEGGAQRIQEDCNSYYVLLINLLTNFLRNGLIFIVFCGIIWMQLGPIYLLVPITYTLIGTGIAWKLAIPLINLNYKNQQYEAAFRHKLQSMTRRIKDKSRAILLIFTQVFDNNMDLYKTTKKLTYFQSFYNQVTVMVPYIILAPIYFGGKITFGILMQTASGMGHIIDSLSYLINSFNDINKFLSCQKRLREVKLI